MKMVVTGDLHLNVKNRLPDFVENLGIIAAKTREIHPEVYAIVGDIFDKRNPSSEVLKAFADHLKEVKANQIRIVRGNHDRTNDEIAAVDWCDLDPRVVVKDEFDFILGNKRILLLHETLDGSLIGSKDFTLKGKKLPSFKGYDLVIAGDIHKPQILQNKNPLVLIPGSLERVSFAERSEEKFFYVINCVVPGTLEPSYVERLQLPARPMLLVRYNLEQKTVDINDCRSSYDALQKLLSVDSGRQPIVHLILIGKRENIRKINYDKLVKNYRNVYHLDIKVEYEDNPNFSEKEDRSMEKVDINNSLEEYCKQNKLDEQTLKLAKKVIEETK